MVVVLICLRFIQKQPVQVGGQAAYGYLISFANYSRLDFFT